jgi:glycosyltransferase involved in cell wall biosynthesis
MRIAVNTRLLLKDKMEGIGWFTYETLNRIVRSHPEIEFLFIFDRKPHPDFIFGENVKPIVASPQARHPFLWYLFFEIGVARVLKRYNPDIFVSPDGWLSLRSSTPQLAVIHDLNFEEHPEFIEKLSLKYYRRYFPRYAQKAKRIVAVSNYTKKDIARRYGVNSAKIDVVYNGVNPKFAPIDASEIQEIRNRFSDGQPYFLFVGLIHPRKNLFNQVQAFLQMKEATGSKIKYLIVGEVYSSNPKLDELLKSSRFGSDVNFLGRQNLDCLVKLYASAFALTYVSYFEGFGIPIIEAMKSGVPVITSRTSSMPEIAADAGLLVDPNSPDDIAEAMIQLLERTEVYSNAVHKGLRRAADFTWDKSAEQLFTSIMKSLKD